MGSEPVVSGYETSLAQKTNCETSSVFSSVFTAGKELFVNEYRLMLADKLLQKSNSDAAAGVRIA